MLLSFTILDISMIIFFFIKKIIKKVSTCTCIFKWDDIYTYKKNNLLMSKQEIGRQNWSDWMFTTLHNGKIDKSIIHTDDH